MNIGLRTVNQADVVDLLVYLGIFEKRGANTRLAEHISECGTANVSKHDYQISITRTRNKQKYRGKTLGSILNNDVDDKDFAGELFTRIFEKYYNGDEPINDAETEELYKQTKNFLIQKKLKFTGQNDSLTFREYIVRLFLTGLDNNIPHEENASAPIENQLSEPLRKIQEKHLSLSGADTVEEPCDDCFANEISLHVDKCGTISSLLSYSFYSSTGSQASGDTGEDLPFYTPYPIPYGTECAHTIEKHRQILDIFYSLDDDYERFSKAIILLLDCPNADDVDPKGEVTLASGISSDKLNAFFESRLSNLLNEKVAGKMAGDSDIILMSAIQFRCFFKEEQGKEQKEPNFVFESLWAMDEVRDDFRDRLSRVLNSYERVLIINSCTEENKGRIKEEISKLNYYYKRPYYRETTPPITWK